jgi:formate-dependent nitrite reductase membrane component NrfD
VAAHVTAAGSGWRQADRGPVHKRRKRGGGRGGGGNRELSMVGDAEFVSYYGRPIIKEPVWKSPEVPLYLFFGGAAGSSAVLGALGEFTKRPSLTRAAHLFAGGGALASVGLLVVDLGRPERFLHMLRVFKPTSPLSVGTYILSPFSALSVATAGLHVLGWFPPLRKLAAVGSAVFAGPLATYTGVLLANTAVPSWHAAGTELPIVFGASGMAAGGGITMALSPVAEAAPARKMAVAGAAIELAVMQRVESGHGIVSEPYHEGKAGKLLKAAKACTVGGAGLTLLAGRSRLGAIAAGALLAAGSALTRFGVFDAGVASAKDPKYTVVPQRERLAARQNGHAPTITP